MCECKCETVELKVVKTYHDNGKLHQEYTEDDQGRKHGTYRDWRDNEQLWSQCEYINGKLHGTYQYWHDNGQLWEQSEWVNDIRHGIIYAWEDDGSLKYIRQYDNGKTLVEVIFEQDNQRLKKPIIQICAPNHAKAGDGLIQVIKVLQEKGIKFKIAKIGE